MAGVQILPGSCICWHFWLQDPIRIPPGSCQDPTRILHLLALLASGSHQDPTRIPSGSHHAHDDLERDHVLLEADHTDLQRAHNRLTGGQASTVVADPTHFKRSAHDRVAPFNPATKTGNALIEQAQSALQHLFDGKPLSLQPFLNALSADVTACHLQEAVTISNTPTLPGLAVGDPDINVLTGCGTITDDIMVAFFTETRRNQIRGADDNGNAIA